jgi:hypothetical protein
MHFRNLALLAAATLTLSTLQAQTKTQPAVAKAAKTTAKSWTPPRLPDGHPDFQGFWANNAATPMERPAELANHPVLTDDEVKAMREKADEMFVSGKVDAAFGDQIFRTVWANVKGTKVGFTSTDGGTGDYSSEWNDHRVWDNRTSLITDPADGHMPALSEEGKKRRAGAFGRMQRPAGPEDRPLQERCITYGAPQLVAGYQSYYQIVQAPKAMMLMTEMIHDVRIMPIDAGPHPGAAVQTWMGDSRAHWEGDTLVVDTTNFKPRAFMSFSSEKLHIIERFTRTSADVLQDEITVDDPGTWSRPWTLMVPLHRSADPVYEYACHEGNEGIVGILKGARAEDAAEAAAKAKK